MKVKKLISLVLIVVLCVSLFSGCSNDSKTGDQPYQIDWYFYGDNQVDLKSVEAAVNEHVSDEMNISLKLHPLDWSGLPDKVNVMMAGGEKFDMVMTEYARFLTYINKNALLPLDELLDKYGKGIKENLGDEYLDSVKVKGKIYSIPTKKERGYHGGIIYNKEIAEKHNLVEMLDNVKTYEDIVPILEIIKEKEPDMIPYSPQALPEYDLEEIVFPAYIYKPGTEKEGQIVNILESPELLELAKNNKALFDKGLLPQGGFTGINESRIFARTYVLKPGKDVEMSDKATTWKQIDIETPVARTIDAMGAMTSISATCKNPEVVMQFMNRIYTDPELLNMLTYGIEGKHYEKIGENRIKEIKDSGYSFSAWRWQFFDCFGQYLIESDDEEKNENLEKYNEILIPSHALGFLADTEPIKQQVTGCSSVKNILKKTVIDGIEDPESSIKKHAEKIKALGGDEIVAEVQRQYNEWLKTK